MSENVQDNAARDGIALPACPVETTLTLIRDKWTVLALRDLLGSTNAETDVPG